MPLPDFLRNKPRIPAWFSVYWEAFHELSGDRGGMGDGRILWTACHLWARAHNLTSRQESDLVYYVRVMDSALLEWRAKKQ